MATRGSPGTPCGSEARRGRLKTVSYWVDIAKRDYRDVLAYAEYPGYMKKVPPSEEILAAERQEIINQDWLQYQMWLRKK